MLLLAILLATWLAPSSSTGFVPPSTAVMRPAMCFSHAQWNLAGPTRFPALCRPQRARCNNVLGGVSARSVLPFPDARVLTKVDFDVACVLCDSEAKALLSLKKSQPGQPRQLRDASMRIPPPATEGRFSVDLGKRSIEGLRVAPDGVSLPETPEGSPVDLTWDDLKRIAKKGGAWRCYWGTAGYEPSRVDGFSELTDRSASLYPLEGSPPTVVLGGFGMHRFAGDASPAMDTKLKLQARPPPLVGCTVVHGEIPLCNTWDSAISSGQVFIMNTIPHRALQPSRQK